MDTIITTVMYLVLTVIIVNVGIIVHLTAS